MRKLIYCFFCAVAVGFTSCDLIEYHPYDGDVKGDTRVNAKNIRAIERNTAGKSEIRVAVISDTHSWYDEVDDLVESVNGRGNIDFVIHCGDLTDFGMTNEFEWARILLDKLNVPYVALLGNHDCLGTGKDVYQEVFGAENFAFTAGKTRVICLNTNAQEFDFSEPVPKLSFIDNEIAKMSDSVVNTIVAMHIMPLADEFNNDVAASFEHRLNLLKNTRFCVCGHGHKTIVEDVFDDGLLYYEIGTPEDRQYYVFTIAEESYECEIIDY